MPDPTRRQLWVANIVWLAGLALFCLGLGVVMPGLGFVVGGATSAAGVALAIAGIVAGDKAKKKRLGAEQVRALDGEQAGPRSPIATVALVVLVVSGITLIGQAAFVITLPHEVMVELVKARTKVDRDHQAENYSFNVPGKGMVRLDRMTAEDRAAVPAWLLESANLPTDGQIDTALADPSVLEPLIARSRAELRNGALAKAMAGLLFGGVAALALLRRRRTARWLAWIGVVVGVVASIGLFVGMDDIRAARRYYDNTPLRIVEFLALATVPLAAAACVVIARTRRTLA